MSETCIDSAIVSVGRQIHTAMGNLEIQAVKIAIEHIDNAIGLMQMAGMDEEVIDSLDTAANEAVGVENHQDTAIREIGVYVCALGIANVYTGAASTQRQLVRPLPSTPQPAVSRKELARAQLARQEKALTEMFAATVEAINFSALAIIPPDRSIPRSLDKFRLIPLMRTPGVLHDEGSLAHTARYYEVPENIRTTYSHNNPKPYLDTQCTIGLVYDGWLVAAAGAGLTPDGDLKIIMLQNVAGPAGKPTYSNPKAHFKTGLYDGPQWRDTLVEAWTEVARQTGIANSVVIQSAHNNMYDAVRMPIKRPDGSTQPQGYDAFDQVAKRMGFIQDKLTGDWIRPVRSPDNTDPGMRPANTTFRGVAAVPASHAAA